MQTSTHAVSIGAREVRKEFLADHEAQAEREWACLELLAEHAPGLAPRPLRRERLTALGIADLNLANVLWVAFWLAMLLPGGASWRRNPPGTTEGQAAHFMALAGAD